MSSPIVVVGAGHNGLVAACHLAGAGRDVLVLEALCRPPEQEPELARATG